MTNEEITVETARERLEDLVRTAAVGGRTRIRASHGEIAYLIGAQELADLEDWAAVGQHEVSRRSGTLKPGIPFEEALTQLGLRQER